MRFLRSSSQEFLFDLVSLGNLSFQNMGGGEELKVIDRIENPSYKEAGNP
jgi:hypothetical protein